MSKLLIDEPPLQVIPALAVRFGLNEAIILQQVHYWLGDKRSGVVIDGRKFIYNSYEEWQAQFPFWSKRTIQRGVMTLEESGVLITIQRGTDRRKFYAIDYDKLDAHNDKLASSIVPSWHDGTCQDGTMLNESETTTEITTSSSPKNGEAQDPLPLQIPTVQTHPPVKKESDETVFYRRFVEVTRLPKPEPTSEKEKRAVASAWWQPIRRMVKVGNGSSITVMERAVKKMTRDGCGLADPRALEKVFLGELRLVLLKESPQSTKTPEVVAQEIAQKGHAFYED